MNPRLLIVDDDADTRGLLASFAAGEGYASDLAASGEEALQLLNVVQPDLILLDAVMPGLSGFETCRRIKAGERNAHVPVIFMTGLTETEHVVQGLSAGGVDYVTKPLALDELAARIRVHIATARTTRGALFALDSVGARLLTADETGGIGWATPEMQRLLDEMDVAAMEELRDALRSHTDRPREPVTRFDYLGQVFSLTMLGPGASGEHLFRLEPSSEGMETLLLQQAFGLTPREADVLLWTAHGKSNKDMSEILNISARTVNKHLEQIFIKVGVENRAAAAAAATRALLR